MKIQINNMPSAVISSKICFFPYYSVILFWRSWWFSYFWRTYYLLLLFWLLTLLNHICSTKAGCGAAGVRKTRCVLGQRGPRAIHPWWAVLGGVSSVSFPSSLTPWWSPSVAEMNSFQLHQWSVRTRPAAGATAVLQKLDSLKDSKFFWNCLFFYLSVHHYEPGVQKSACKKKRERKLRQNGPELRQYCCELQMKWLLKVQPLYCIY